MNSVSMHFSKGEKNFGMYFIENQVRAEVNINQMQAKELISELTKWLEDRKLNR